jgi:hypothetical protein
MWSSPARLRGRTKGRVHPLHISQKARFGKADHFVAGDDQVLGGFPICHLPLLHSDEA